MSHPNKESAETIKQLVAEGHWSWEGRNALEQLIWERDLFRDMFDGQGRRIDALHERVRELERHSLSSFGTKSHG